jgi:hypothetical protein
MIKGFCYLFLILGFLLFFNKDPVFCIIIVGGGLGLYVLFKVRKKEGSSHGGGSGFFSRNIQPQNEQSETMKNLMMFMAMQQMFSSQPQNTIPLAKRNSVEVSDEKTNGKYDKDKQEILQLLEED